MVFLPRLDSTKGIIFCSAVACLSALAGLCVAVRASPSASCNVTDTDHLCATGGAASYLWWWLSAVCFGNLRARVHTEEGICFCVLQVLTILQSGGGLLPPAFSDISEASKADQPQRSATAATVPLPELEELHSSQKDSLLLQNATTEHTPIAISVLPEHQLSLDTLPVFSGHRFAAVFPIALWRNNTVSSRKAAATKDTNVSLSPIEAWRPVNSQRSRRDAPFNAR